MSTPDGYLSPAVAGSGAIAVGLAASMTTLGEVRLLARSDGSAWRAEEQVESVCAKLEGADHTRLKVTTDAGDLAGCDLVVEAIAEDFEAKAELLGSLAEHCPDADLASTTSSLGIGSLAERIGEPERFFCLHVFNPVTKMELVELCLPTDLAEGVGERAHDFCAALGKRGIEVPDQAGFVVNRLLFPFLFSAVRLLESSGMAVEEVDSCMTMGAAHPLGPLQLLDFVGIDVAVAIGEIMHAETGDPDHRPPALLSEMAGSGRLGRKSGGGFYNY